MLSNLQGLVDGDSSEICQILAEIKNISESLALREGGSNQAFRIYKLARDGLEIMTLDRIQRDMLRKLSDGHETFQGHVVSEAVLGYLKNNQKINAIKEFRTESGLGLKEAKDWVEAYAAKHGLLPSW